MKLSTYDVVDENDKQVNQRADYNEVHAKGLWHRGVHVLIHTPDKQIMVQKRAPTLGFHPSEVEITAGGGVDAGETPTRAAIRETKEELGIRLAASDLRYVGKTRYNHRTKNLIKRTFIYSYIACVPLDRLKLSVNPEETSSAFLIPERQLRTALRRHRIKNIGKISPQYAYWKSLLDSI